MAVNERMALYGENHADFRKILREIYPAAVNVV